METMDHHAEPSPEDVAAAVRKHLGERVWELSSEWDADGKATFWTDPSFFELDKDEGQKIFHSLTEGE